MGGDMTGSNTAKRRSAHQDEAGGCALSVRRAEATRPCCSQDGSHLLKQKRN